MSPNHWKNSFNKAVPTLIEQDFLYVQLNRPINWFWLILWISNRSISGQVVTDQFHDFRSGPDGQINFGASHWPNFGPNTEVGNGFRQYQEVTICVLWYRLRFCLTDRKTRRHCASFKWQREKACALKSTGVPEAYALKHNGKDNRNFMILKAMGVWTLTYF